MTGLHPESHGIIGNNFYDPHFEAEFVYTDPSRSHAGKWWGGEPVGLI
jgi:predicted AlkP superfamily pyrophosphatase or phosphodiesterase